MAGIQAGNAGRLSIEIVAEIARLQQDLDRAKRAVKAASGDIAHSMRAANDNMAGGVQRVVTYFQDLGRSTTDASSKIGLFGKALGALGIGLGIRELGRMADQWSDLRARLTNATGSAEDAGVALRRIGESARATYSSLDQTAQGFLQNNLILRDLGVTTEQQLDLMEALNNSLVVSGAKGHNAAMIMGAFGRSMAEGKLKGQELNLMLTYSSRTVQALADGLGVSTLELRKMVAAGQVTSDKMFTALISQMERLSEEAEEMPATFGDGMLLMGDRLLQLIGRIDQAAGSSENLAGVMVALADNLEAVAVGAVAAAAAFAAMKLGGVVSTAAAYVGQLIALEKALGATTTASALFGVVTKAATTSFRALTVAMMANPFTLIAAAIAGVTALLYANRDSQVSVGEETVRLGDIFLGVWELIKDGIAIVQTIFTDGWAVAFAKVSPALAAVGGFFDQVFTAIREKVRAVVNGAVGLFVGLGRAAAAIFSAEDVVGAFRSGLGADYVGALEDGIRSGIVALADYGKAAREAEAAANAAAGGVGKLGGALDEQAKKTKKAKEELSELEKEMKRRNEETVRFIASLRDEIEKIGLNEKALRQLEIAKAKDVAVTQEQRDEIERLNQRREDAIALQERINQLREAQAGTRELEKSVAAIEREVEVLGLAGWARDKRLLQMEREAELAPVLNAQLLAQLAGNKALTDQIQKHIDLINRRYGVQIQLGDLVDQDREAAEVLRVYNDELRETISLLQHMGGMGGVLGGLLGLSSGNFGGLRGSIGALLNTVTSTRKDEKTGEIITVRLGDELRMIFGMNGPFGRTLTTALHSAGIGMAAGNALLGNQSTTGQIGSAIGGAAGQAAGKAVLGFLGGAAGPVGSIVGGILGGIAGGLLGGGNKTAGAVVTAGGYSVAGADKQNHGVAGDLGKSVYDGLQKIADKLGATIGGFQVAIGTRGGEYRINTGGTSLKYDQGAQGFGQDSAAAISAAIADAIKDGALQGLSASAAALLRKGGDIETQLQKALTFEGVFAELERMKDPAGAALKELDSAFADLRRLFDEASASTAERAQLEELYALKRAEIAQQTAQQDEDLTRRRELEIALMQAQGDYMGALAAARQQELAELPEALHVLQQQVWAAELLNDRRGLEIELMRALGDEAGATAAQRQIELAATHESLRALKEQIWAAQDAAEAEGRLQQVRMTAAEIARSRRDLEIRLMEATGDAAGALAARREMELAALDTTLHALLQQVWAAEDLAKTEDDLNRVRMTAAEIARTRQSLEIELMDALGNSSEALAARRGLELAALDASLHALQQQVWAAQDAARANEELARAQEAAAGRMANLQVRLAEAQGNDAEALRLRREAERAEATDAELAMLAKIFAAEDAARKAALAAEARAAAQRAAEERARAAEQAAAERARIAEARGRLEIDLLRALGRESEALALHRKLELAAMDASLRGLQKTVWYIQDTASELTGTIDKFSQFGDSLREFREGLYAAERGIGASYRQLQVDFLKTAGLAQAGDEAAFGKLTGAGDAFLDAARAQAASQVEYQRAVAMVARSIDASIAAADEAVDYAHEQLSALERLVMGQAGTNAALAGIHAALDPMVVPPRGGDIVADGLADLRAEMKAANAKLEAKFDRIAVATEKTAKESADTNTKYLQRVVENDAVRTRARA